ncbi:SDR family oxidoreductase [Sphingobacterium sp. ML3W]|uniref:SDR family oxidoreductase n=1 Tax=Sphingobacterium sp. ML3W TaxID=1538644 RepID=UPI00249B042B|nr:SDR family oxidoreductase [Sphingobacterium sp. ML3W]WFA78196.1 SDR family oxidoreductase [Sphingobacterium sp. ML3W]
MKDIFDITNKIILFSGGYGYLGSPCVKYLASCGARLYILARDERKFTEQFGDLSNIIFVKCDIGITEEINSAIDEVFKIEGRIDVFINNAFYLKGQSPENMSDEDFMYGVDGTLNSVFRVIRKIIPIFKNQKYGKIINVSSMYGVVAPDFTIYEDSPGSLNPPHYGAAKAGLIQLSKYYASYLGKDNIQVNCVTPGPFPSDSVKRKDPAFERRLADNTMLKRVGIPEDLIGVFMLLVSNASDFITGQNIIVDGGWTSK